MSSEQLFKYTFKVTIIIRGTPTKKNAVRDSIVTQLNNAKAAGNIESGEWEITGELAPEGGSV